LSDKPKRRAPAFMLYVDDFLGGTSEMSAEEVGGYIRLLCHQWTKGGLPYDEPRLGMMAGLMGSPSLGYVIAKFTLCADGKLRHPRLEALRTERDAFLTKQAESGREGAKKRWENRPANGNPNGEPMPNPLATPMANGCPNDSSPSPSPSPTNTHPLTPTGGVPVSEPPKEEPKAKRTRKQRGPNSIPEGFDEFWEAYPRKMAKGDAIKAWGQMDAGQHLAKILETVKASAKLEAWTKDGGRFVPFPATWLRAQRWEDELSIFIETKAQLMEKIKANRGWPNHPDHANATEDEKALQVELAARWRNAE